MKTTFKLFTGLGIAVFVALLIVLILPSCGESGHTSQDLSGEEYALPAELKGLKIYTIRTGTLDYAKVAIFNNMPNSVTYSVGKTQETTILINNNTSNKRTIVAKEIISETNDIIVIRK